MRASAGQCGLDSSYCSASTVEVVVCLDHPGIGNRDEASESAMFCAATLHCFGLPYQYAK